MAMAIMTCLVLYKNQYISKLDQIIKDFEYLSLKGVSTGQQFSDLKNQFENQVHETEKELYVLDEKISCLNKIISAIDGLSSDDLRKIYSGEIEDSKTIASIMAYISKYEA